ncbi:hypothetical protein MNEG_11049 [Monoraphidium neglectum]|uniref:Uncharacterized protein n=1 Tax=Monoraphidium neglectum TaxID=145388 RepID=A0A0D2JAY9_9CHLO|nr:hypothetical protein MNEG_11049 [Monoraphidium neglectum]KIY96912.1 hypothetical protein MNEG_11049 [Monoraphidium neglectum]|eukprot:XP_013895932.1 hypothetical protein MNEG_11049 [Monoraphidium neglectum]
MTASPTTGEALRLAFCCCGIIGSLVVYGVLQERVMTLPYGKGDNKELFRFSLFLVFCNRLVAALIALATMLAKGAYSELRPVAPIQNYASVSLSNVLATTCQYEALKHVSFAVQTLGKCAKMFPVMAWGFLMLRKRYGARDVALAAAITGGCFVFFTFGPTASRCARRVAGAPPAAGGGGRAGRGWRGQRGWRGRRGRVSGGPGGTAWGVLLMSGYLVADGYTSTFQQAMFKGYQMSTYNQVMYTCLCSLVLSSFGLATSGQLPDTFRFLRAHPEALGSILALSTAASCGSLFISFTIKTYGALTFATIMTTRQLISILLSALIFSNPLTRGQWCAPRRAQRLPAAQSLQGSRERRVGTVMVVTALYYQGLTKEAAHGKAGAAPRAPAAAAAAAAAEEKAPLVPGPRPGTRQGEAKEGGRV